MLNKINNLLMQSSKIAFRDILVNAITISSPVTSDTFTLPSGIEDNTLGIFLTVTTKNATINSATNLGTPQVSNGSSFILIDEIEQMNGGTGRGCSIGLYYKHMTAADSGQTLTNLFLNTTGTYASLFFIQIVLTKDSVINGVGSSFASAGSAGGQTVTFLDVPSLIPKYSQFILVTMSTASDGSLSTLYSGGMTGLGYAIAEELLEVGTSTYTGRMSGSVLVYDSLANVPIADTADFISTISGSGFTTGGNYAIWLL